MDVTTTASGAGKFETRFYHMVMENEFGRVKGHFGPVHTLAFHPDGRRYATAIRRDEATLGVGVSLCRAAVCLHA